MMHQVHGAPLPLGYHPRSECSVEFCEQEAPGPAPSVTDLIDAQALAHVLDTVVRAWDQANDPDGVDLGGDSELLQHALLVARIALNDYAATAAPSVCPEDPEAATFWSEDVNDYTVCFHCGGPREIHAFEDDRCPRPAPVPAAPAEPGETAERKPGRVANPDDWGSSVTGKCPACGWSGLFIGSGGYVTCSQYDCPDPGAASDLLAARPAPAEPAERDDHDGHTIDIGPVRVGMTPSDAEQARWLIAALIDTPRGQEPLDEAAAFLGGPDGVAAALAARPAPVTANTTYPCKVQLAGSGTCSWPTCECGDA